MATGRTKFFPPSYTTSPWRSRKIYNVYFLAIIATMGGMLFGLDISSISAIIGTDQYKNYFDNPNGVAQGAIGSALAAGLVVGSIIAGPISDKIGRRDSLMFACLWWLLGTAVQVACNGRGMLIAGRVLNGVTVGNTSSQVPVYLADLKTLSTWSDYHDSAARY